MSLPPLFSSFQTKPLLAIRAKGAGSRECSRDLNRTFEEASISDEGVEFADGFTLPWHLIEEIAEEERKVFAVLDGEARAIRAFSESTGWVRTLCATEAGPPTTLISGIPMHRIKDTDPLRDTFAKMRAFGRIEGSVLDTATGLGYTAIEAAKVASELTTIELDPAAIEIAKFNPWSSELFESPRIRQIVGDAFEVIQSFPSGAFQGVLHDPPTMSLGGELYSQEFYGYLHRSLKKGGRLFHYVADPNSAIGKKQYPGIIRRLKLAGFAKIVIEEQAFGISARA